ncbi:MAG: methyltransferase domain-containing protein [bacterium]
MNNKIKICITLIRTNGFRLFIIKLIKKIFRVGMYRPMKDFKNIELFFYKKYGLEIGGPSSIFLKNRFIPVYDKMESLDGVNFSKNTIWSNSSELDNNFYIEKNKKVGKLYIADATDLQSIQKKNYDFVLSSNNIEHIANPIKAIEEWLSVLKDGGVLVVVAPKKESNFDNKREVVTFEHLLNDYRKNTKEDDLSHLNEILSFHDLKMDLATDNIEEFKKRSLNNFQNRCLHQHVFDLNVLQKIYQYFKLSILKTTETDDDYIIIGEK